MKQPGLPPTEAKREVQRGTRCPIPFRDINLPLRNRAKFRAREIARNFRVAQTGHFIEFRANRTLYRLCRIRTLYGFLPTKYQIVRGARHSPRVSGAGQRAMPRKCEPTHSSSSRRRSRGRENKALAPQAKLARVVANKPEGLSSFGLVSRSHFHDLAT